MNTYANLLYCHSLSNKLTLEFFRTRFHIFKITLQIPQTGSVFAFWGISKQPLRNCPVKPSIFPAFNSIFLVTIFLVLLLQEWNNMFCFLIAGSIGNLKLINVCKNTYSNINTCLLIKHWLIPEGQMPYNAPGWGIKGRRSNSTEYFNERKYFTSYSFLSLVHLSMFSSSCIYREHCVSPELR